jgi:hypothetical protein
MLSNYGNSNADFTDLECTIKKKMRTTLVSALFIQFGTYYFCSISYYYYYITPTVVGWCIAILFFHLGYHGNGHHFEFFQPPQKRPHTTVDIPTKFHKVWWKESKNILNPPFFVSMATAAKFVQLIPICLAYLVPLNVDVVPIKFHQFLFGE